MITYKGFETGLVCRGYQFRAHEVNVCEKAKTAREGFHSAENPFDVLRYYPDPAKSEYWMCVATGDVDEDSVDSKVSSTELRLFEDIGIHGILIHGACLHCLRPEFWEDNHRRFRAKAEARFGYAIAVGENAMAMGEKEGDRLVVLDDDGSVKLCEVGEHGVKPNVWYNARGEEVSG